MNLQFFHIQITELIRATRQKRAHFGLLFFIFFFFFSFSKEMMENKFLLATGIEWRKQFPDSGAIVRWRRCLYDFRMGY